jgi:hypothetical protein
LVKWGAIFTVFSQDKDMITMFEHAYKRQPANEELGAQTFFANVRTGNWKTAQQVMPLSNTYIHIMPVCWGSIPGDRSDLE